MITFRLVEHILELTPTAIAIIAKGSMSILCQYIFLIAFDKTKARSSAIAETAGVTIRSVIAVDRLILTVTLNYDLLSTNATLVCDLSDIKSAVILCISVFVFVCVQYISATVIPIGVKFAAW